MSVFRPYWRHPPRPSPLATLSGRSAPQAIEVSYLDASVSGPTDPDAVWTNDANAFDGSTSTYASTTTSGSDTTNELTAAGHTSVNAKWNNFLKVRTRFYGAHIGASGGLSFLAAFGGSLIYPRLVHSASTTTDTPDWSAWLQGFESLEPLTQVDFDQIYSIHYQFTAGEARQFKTEIEWTYFPNHVCTTYRFDASDEGPTDPDASWASDTLPFLAFASGNQAALTSDRNGSHDTNELSAGGTNAPSSGPDIVEVYARLIGDANDYAAINADIFTDGKAENLGTVTTVTNYPNTNFSTDEWKKLVLPSGGWTWPKVQALECYAYGTGWVSGVATGRLYNVQIKVVHEIPADRIVNCTTKTITLTPQATTVGRGRKANATQAVVTLTPQASVVIKGRGALATSAAITVTGQAAAVVRSRAIFATQAVITLTPQATTTGRGREADATQAAITLTPQAATIIKGRGALATSNAITLTPQAATVARSRAVFATQATITLTPQAATAGRGREADATQGVITLTPQVAAVVRTRAVAATTAQITLTPQAALVPRPRDVLATAQAITLTPQAAAVGRGREADATQATITLTPQAAAVTRSRAVAAATAQITLTPQAAAVSKARAVQATTTAITLTPQPVIAGRGREADATQLSIILTTQPSAIGRGRTANATQAVITLTPQAAAVIRARAVAATSQNITLTPFAANIGNNRIVNATSGVITLTPQQAAVSRGRAVAATQAALTLAVQAASVLRARAVAALSANLVITGQPATISGSRMVECTSAVITLTPLPAGVARSRAVNATSAQITLTTQPALIQTDERLVDATTATITVTPQSAIVQRGVTKFFLYLVTTAPTEDDVHVAFGVTLIDAGGGGPVFGLDTDMLATVVQSGNTEYVESPGLWPFINQPYYGTVTGYLAFDGVDQVIDPENGYGVDILFQHLYLSPDWDIVHAPH
jgi:hypothetical protein